MIRALCTKKILEHVECVKIDKICAIEYAFKIGIYAL